MMQLKNIVTDIQKLYKTIIEFVVQYEDNY